MTVDNTSNERLIQRVRAAHDRGEISNDLCTDILLAFSGGAPARGPSATAVDQRPCTCHPTDRPPICQHRYGARECQDAYRAYITTRITVSCLCGTVGCNAEACNPTTFKLAITAAENRDLRAALATALIDNSPHSVEEDFQHWLTYTGGTGTVRQAYYAGADVPPPLEEDSQQPNNIAVRCQACEFVGVAGRWGGECPLCHGRLVPTQNTQGETK